MRVAPGSSLARGLLVDASILARLLGIRLLRLDAHITVVPAEPAPRVPTPPPVPVGRLKDAVDLLGRASRTLDEVTD